MQHLKNIKKIIILFLFLLILDLIGSIFFLKKANNTVYNNYNKKIPSLDAGIVFFSGFDKSLNLLNPETLRRINFAMKLYKIKAIENIICVGGARPSRKTAGSELMKRIFIRLGLPKEKVFEERISRDTYSNLIQAIKIIKLHNWKKVGVISSPLHVFRIKSIFSFPEHIYVEYLPYPYNYTYPRIDLFTLWLQIHHEWIAWTMWKLLPVSIYEKIIKVLRN